MFDVGLLKGVNVVLLCSVTVNLAELWRVAGGKVCVGVVKRESCAYLTRCETYSYPPYFLPQLIVIHLVT